MGTGYTRNDTANNIADGNIINASDLDGEFDAVQSAFNASTGHTHDGTAGEGAPIETIGPSQDVVATASVLRPKTDNTVDLGTTSLEYKDLFLDGTAHIDTLDVDENASITGTLGVTGTTTLGTANITTGTITTADINGGNIDGTIIGASSAAAITGTTITGTSFVTSGDMTFGDNDKAVFGAGSDLQIYHSGSQSFVQENGTGQLVLDTQNGARVKLTANNGTENMVVANKDGDVELYYDNAKKLATTSTGVDITGNLTAGYLAVGTTGDSYSQILINSSTTGESELRMGDTDTDAGSVSYTNSNDTMTFRAAAGARMALNSTGVDITGTLTSDGLTVGGIVEIDGSAFGNTSKQAFTRTDASWSINNETNFRIYGSTGDTTSPSTKRMELSTNGDISFYEDTGTTAKFFWDASAESLGIGTTDTNNGRSLVVHTPSTVAAGGTQASINNLNGNFAMIGYRSSGLANDSTVRAGAYQDDFAIYTGAAERMRIDSSGNVGIGLTPENSGGTWRNFEQGGMNLAGRSAGGADGMIGTNYVFKTNNSEVYKTTAGTSRIFFDANELRFQQAASGTAGTAISWSEAMRIDSSGRVGIGTTSPEGDGLHVQGSDNNNDDDLISLGFTFDANSKVLGTIGVHNSASNTGGLKFSTKNAGTLAERMRIDSNGNVGIGTSSIVSYPKVTIYDASTKNAGFVLQNTTTGQTSNDGLFVGLGVGGSGDATTAYLYHRESGPLVFATDNSEAMRIDSSGRVGIGTDSPSRVAELYNTSNPALRINNGTDIADIGLASSAGAFATSSTSGALVLARGGANDINFATNGTNRVTIDSSGNVGIGVSSIGGVKMDVLATASDNLVARFENNHATGSYGISVKAGDDSGNYAADFANKSGTSLMRIRGDGNVGIGTSSPSDKLTVAGNIVTGVDNTIIAPYASLLGFVKKSGTAGSIAYASGQSLIFSQSSASALSDASSETYTERMRIDSSGTTSFHGISGRATGSTGHLSISEQTYNRSYLESATTTTSSINLMAFINPNGAIGSISVSGSSTAFNTSSDYRLKENVVELTGATDRIKQIPVHRFNFIADADTIVDGFLAHEVQGIVPEAVTGAKDAMRDEEYEVTPAVLDDDGNVVTEAVMGTRSVPDYQGIDQSKLVPLLVATIQELEARITALENA